MHSESTSSANQSTKSFVTPLIITFCAISAFPLYLVFTKTYIYGSKAGHWMYPYFGKTTSIPLGLPVSVFILVSLTIFYGKKLIVSHEKVTLLVGFFMAIFIQILIHEIYPISLDTVVQSDVDTTFYSQATRFSPFEILSQFNNLAPTLPGHAKSNMPGKILLFQLFEFFTKSPGLIGYLIISLSTLGAPLLYGICKILFHDKQAGLYAFILYTLVPCKLFFFPILNTVTPLFMLLCLYLFLVYIERRRTLYLVLLGVALYVLILFEPSPLVTGLIFIGILIHALVNHQLFMNDVIRIGIITIFAFLGAYLIFLVFFSFDLLSAFQLVFKDAGDFNRIQARGYWTWFSENLKEFFYSVGLPIMMIFIYQTFQIFSDWKKKKSIQKVFTIENVYNLSLIATFSTVLFLGINRGEVTRLWIYLAVLFQVPAAYFIAKNTRSNLQFFILASTLIVQSMLTLHRIGFVLP